MKKVKIYTDGACSGNPGPGGWGAILKYGNVEKEISGGEALTTNNRQELLGVISALEILKEPCIVEIYSDSKYVVDAINKKWVYEWELKGWKRKTGEVANPDLWQRLLPLLEKHTVTFIWIKGHSDNEYNERCDKMAVKESKKYSI